MLKKDLFSSLAYPAGAPARREVNLRVHGRAEQERPSFTCLTAGEGWLARGPQSSPTQALLYADYFLFRWRFLPGRSTVQPGLLTSRGQAIPALP